MNRNQQRTAFRQRRKAHPGRHDGRSSYSSPAFEMGRRLMGITAMRRAALDEQKREADAQRAIPVSGPGRRRAKALRNQAAVYERWPELRPRAVGTAADLT